MHKKSKGRIRQAALTVSALSALTFPAFVYGQSGNIGSSSSESGYSSNQGVMGPAGTKSNPESPNMKDTRPSSRKDTDLSSSSEMKAKDQTMKDREQMATESDKDKKSSKESKNAELSRNSEMKAKDQTMKDRDQAATDSDKMQKGDKDSSAKSTEHDGNASMASADKAAKTKQDRTGAEPEANKSANQ